VNNEHATPIAREAQPTLSRRHLLGATAAVGGGLLAAQVAGAAPRPHPAQQAAATPEVAGAPGGELLYALTNRFDTLDPNITTSTDVLRIAKHVFDPLVEQPQPGEFIPALATRWEVTDTADVYTFDLSNADGGTNRNRYVNPEVDALIDEAAGTVDRAQRAVLYSTLQIRVLEEAIMVFFSEPTSVNAFRPDEVLNVGSDFSSIHPLFYDTSLAG
jgi:ABC-type transport system substrate-binding protein